MVLEEINLAEHRPEAFCHSSLNQSSLLILNCSINFSLSEVGSYANVYQNELMLKQLIPFYMYVYGMYVC